MLPDAINLGAVRVFECFAALEAPVSAYDLGDERGLHHVCWLKSGFDLFGCVVPGGTEEELQWAHGRGSFSSEIAVGDLRRRSAAAFLERRETDDPDGEDPEVDVRGMGGSSSAASVG
jgi:hypothetical protein